MDTATMIVALAMSPAIIAVGGGLLLGHRKQMAKLRMTGSPLDRTHLERLSDTATRLEQRIHYLENILDSEAPGWRNRSDYERNESVRAD